MCLSSKQMMEGTMYGRIPARVGKLSAALGAAIALLAIGSSVASAHVDKTKEPFTITYASAAITTEGEVTCTGSHETNSAKFPGNATEGGRDKETCASTTGGKFTSLTGGQEGNSFPGSGGEGYESDWFFLKGISITSIKDHYKVRKNDKKFKLIVYVPMEGKYPPIAESL
jgi:hypothetical protein